MKVGLTLPTFVDEPERLLAVARGAEAAGIDAVFTFDHLYRIGTEGRAPSLALEPVLGMLAVETRRIALGSLVIRAAVRHPATLRAALDAVHRIAPRRLVAGVGSGDWLSDPEQEMFGLSTDGLSVRIGALDATVEAIHGRGYPVWIGGRSEQILATAAGLADGWNGWGLSPGAFGLEVERLREACAAAHRDPDQVPATWAGLVELRPERWEEAERRPNVLAGPWERIAETLRRLGGAGASWVVLAPVASSDPDNGEVVAKELVPLLDT